MEYPLREAAGAGDLGERLSVLQVIELEAWG